MNDKKTSLLLMFVFLFSSHFGTALEYGLFAKKGKDTKITQCYVFGERCSGTNYTQTLICSNFNLPMKHFDYPGFKHFPPWYDLPIDHYFRDPSHYTFNGTEDTLFIVVFRNPYDWVRSFHKTPWHAHPKLCGIPFSLFIRSPWELNYSSALIQSFIKLNPLMDLNPDGSFFTNVFKLRSAKIRNYLLMKQRAPNIYYVNYETARDHAERVIQEISNEFNIKAVSPFRPIDTYKGKGGAVYQKKEYSPISEEDLIYINSQLDEELENDIGYQSSIG